MIFAFLFLYGSFVLQLYPGTRVQHLRVRSPRNLKEGGISELCRTIDFCGRVDGDDVSISSKHKL